MALFTLYLSTMSRQTRIRRNPPIHLFWLTEEELLLNCGFSSVNRYGKAGGQNYRFGSSVTAYYIGEEFTAELYFTNGVVFSAWQKCGILVRIKWREKFSSVSLYLRRFRLLMSVNY